MQLENNYRIRIGKKKIIEFKNLLKLKIMDSLPGWDLIQITPSPSLLLGPKFMIITPCRKSKPTVYLPKPATTRTKPSIKDPKGKTYALALTG